MYHLLEQLYHMHYNIRPKSAPKGVTIMRFHPCGMCAKHGHKMCKTNCKCGRLNKSIIYYGGDNVFMSSSTRSWSCFVSTTTNRYHGNQYPNAFQFIAYLKDHWLQWSTQWSNAVHQHIVAKAFTFSSWQ
jgi:hypothetical protein